jgi:chromosome segregation ATPase
MHTEHALACMRAVHALLKDNALKSQISNLKSQISNLKSQISNLKSQISNLKSQISNLKSQISNLKSIIAKSPVADQPLSDTHALRYLALPFARDLSRPSSPFLCGAGG